MLFIRFRFRFRLRFQLRFGFLRCGFGLGLRLTKGDAHVPLQRLHLRHTGQNGREKADNQQVQRQAEPENKPPEPAGHGRPVSHGTPVQQAAVATDPQPG
jgi:hypothetical protein